MFATGDRPKRAGGLAGWQLKRALEVMNASLDRDLALSEPAALVGVSPHHFCRAFKQSTGVPPHRWLVACRVERAKELLEVSALTLKGHS